MEDRIRQLWLDTNLSQDKIATRLDTLPSYVYKVVVASFTVEQRIARKKRVQRVSQTTERVAPPSWYTGPGRSVPRKVLEFCEVNGLLELPPNTSVVDLPTGESVLLHKKDAKFLSQALRELHED